MELVRSSDWNAQLCSRPHSIHPRFLDELYSDFVPHFLDL